MVTSGCSPKPEESPLRPGKQGAARSSQSVSVVALAARQGDVAVYLAGLGSVTPLNTVTVKSRVDGQLVKVHFKEGQHVTNGFLLAEIDPRPFEAQLTQAEGQMIRDQALLENARLDLQRYRVLVSQDSIAKQQLDTQEALVRQYEGAVRVDQGQIDNAKLQLTYCRITSPIEGRVGLRLVDAGNIIHTSDANGLVVITQLQPIAVVFPIPEDSLPAVLKKLSGGETLPVDAFDREQRKKLATGFLQTIDNQIDPTTGTVKLKALFPNKEQELFPNQFVNARLLLDTRRGTTVIPAAAIQRSRQGTFVYTVKEDQTVAVRPVRVGPADGDDVAIDEGLSSGELVVVEGAERLREGSRVEMRVEGAPKTQEGK
ncbi:MAG TPA: multidrug transporter subunit MdtA [Syntrophobacteraceae bacterium]|nr:multidrug transporter subunit MdtA [Syntrophobacteraceae bacterium]